MELRALRVEVEVFDADFEGEVDACGDCRAGVLGGCDFADGAGAEEVAWSDEVVCVPLSHIISNMKIEARIGNGRVGVLPCPLVLPGRG